MDLLIGILGAVAMIGLPASLGFYWIGRDLGRNDATAGVLLVVFATTLVALIVIGVPRGNLPGLAKFAIATPIAFVTLGGLGLFFGIKERRSN